MIILFEKLHDTQYLWSPRKHYYLHWRWAASNLF